MKIAIAGLGAIGKMLARKLGEEALPGMELAGVAARDHDKARRTLAEAGTDAPVLSLEDLAEAADLVVECAPAAIFAEIARPTLAAGKKMMALSVGALLSHFDLVEVARRHGGQIIVPTGALLGLDAVSAAAEGTIHSVSMVTRKPVKGLLGAPYLVEHGIAIEDIKEPLKIFEGTAREAAIGFPANLNVAVALSLAGIGPDKTRLQIWADPTVTRNTHRILVDSDSASLDMTIANIPSENPKTGRITALSVIAALRKMQAPLRVGT
ncbi:MAG: aspartate dehydrogenase [Alphaproteobacteria bacterium]